MPTCHQETTHSLTISWEMITAEICMCIQAKDVPDSNFCNPADKTWPDIGQRVRPDPEADSAMAAPLLCVLMTCMKQLNMCINCRVLMSVIWFVLLLLHIVMHNACSSECQLMLTNDLELTRLYDIHALMLSYRQQNIPLWDPVPFNISAGSGTGTR